MGESSNKSLEILPSLTETLSSKFKPQSLLTTMSNNKNNKKKSRNSLNTKGCTITQSSSQDMRNLGSQNIMETLTPDPEAKHKWSFEFPPNNIGPKVIKIEKAPNQ